MYFNPESGSGHFITIILIFILILVMAVGLIIVVAKFDQRVQNVSNDTVNLTGIVYNGEVYNATTLTMHKAAAASPVLILLFIIFIALILFTIVYMASR